MKTLRLVLTTLVAVATLGFASCSKDGNSSRPVDGEKAMLSISLKSDGTGTRAAGDSKTKEIVNNYIAFAFKSDGALDASAVSADASPKTFTVTTGTKSVYVVANVPAANFTTVKTVADLQEHLEELNVASVSTVTKDNVWASGFGSGITFAQDANTKKWEAAVTVPIKFAVAKVNLKITNNMINLDANDLEMYKVTDVIVLNAVSQSRLFPPTTVPVTTSLMPDAPAYLAGRDNFNVQPPSPTVVPFLKDETLTALDLDASTADFHYYLTENDASDFATIISVVLEKTVAGVVTNRYVPVHFSTELAVPGNAFAGYALIRNNQYQVNLTLIGDAKSEPGVPDPTDTKGEIQVTVELADWNIIADIDKEL